MVIEYLPFKDGIHKNAQCVKLWNKSDNGTKCIVLVAVYDFNPMFPELQYSYRALASSTNEEELKIWWDMQNESIPFSDEKLDLPVEDAY